MNAERREEKRREEKKAPIARLFCSVVEYVRTTLHLLPNRESRVPNPDPVALTPEEFRRMLEETLAADPHFLRRCLQPLAGTVFPFVGGVCLTLAKNVGGDSATDRQFGSSGCNTGSNDYSFSGKLGIGTTSPSTTLEVVGDILAKSGSTGNVYVGGITGSGNGLRLHYTNSPEGAYIDYRGTGNLNFRADSSSGATTRMVVKASSGDVGIGTTSPDSKLDVRGSINKIVFLRPGEDIQTAINNLPSNGGIIYLTPGTYNINSTITINKTGVKIRGYGGSEDASGQLGATTQLLWTGATDITKRVVEMISTVPDNNIGDVEISDLLINCANKAGIGLFLDRVIRSRFVGLYVRDAHPSGGIGIKLTTAATMGSDINSAWNLFENLSVFECSKCLVLDREPNAHGNSSHNQFVGLTLHYRGDTDDDAGIWMGDCDNNTFYRVYLSQNGTRGQGVLVTSPHVARANYFYHLQTVPNAATSFGFRVKNATLPFDDRFKNLIFGYDLSNGNGEPTSDQNNVQSFVFWINSRGQIKGQTP